MDEAYLHAKFHLDPSNRLATVHERYKQDSQDRQRTGSIGRTVLQTVGQKRRKIVELPLQLNLKHSLLVLSTLPFSQFTYRKCSSCLFNARSIVNKTCELHHMLYSGEYQILLVIVFWAFQDIFGVFEL